MLFDKFSTVALIIITLIDNGAPIRTKDKMYELVEGSKPCYRRLNATHQVGCSSSRGGSSGVIHYCESQSDLEFILRNGSAGPYAPIIPASLFTKHNLNLLRSSPKISGLLVHSDVSGRPKSFSHDLQCPNSRFNVENTCGGEEPLWNPHGTGFLFEHLPFPVFFVDNHDDMKFARDCFNKHNNFSYDTQRDRSLCSVELLSFMYAAKDTPTCIRRSHLPQNLNPSLFCDPLSGRNIWSTIYPLDETRKEKFIIVSARLDSTSMFEMTAGGISPITGLVTLLSTAQILSKMLAGVDNTGLNVLFLVLNGETYDYIGSQRLLYDLNNGDFPIDKHRKAKLPTISMNDISLYVELSQLSQSGSVVAHYSKNSKNLERFLLKMRDYGRRNLVNFDTSKGTLPPSSLHTFLRNYSTFPGLVLADHRREYANLYYNSIFDNATNLDYEYLNITEDSIVGNSDSIQRYVGNVSLMVAQTLFWQINGSDYVGDNSKYDLQLIDELFHCYLEDANCRVHQAVQKVRLQSYPFSLYVGVDRSRNYLVDLVALTLGWLTGSVSGASNATCQNDPPNDAYKFYNFSESLDNLTETKCFKVSMNFTDALSPAFIIPDYDWSSGLYSSWSESTWGDIRVRIFLKASAAHENMTIAIGSIVLIFSFISVYFIKSRSDILFSPLLPTLAPTDC